VADVYVRPDGRVPLYHPTSGEEVLVPLAEAEGYVAKGFLGRDPETIKAEILQRHYGGEGQGLTTAALSAGGVLTAGATTWLAKQAGVPVERYEEANPDWSTGGQVVGGIGSVAGGLGRLAAAGGKLAAGGLAAKVAAAGAGGGKLAAGASKLAAGALPIAAGGAAGNMALSASTIGDRIARGEKVSAGDALTEIGKAGALGATIDLAAGGIAALGARGAKAVAGKVADKAGRNAADAAHREAHAISLELAKLRGEESAIGIMVARDPKLADLMRHAEAPRIDPVTRAAAFDQLTKASATKAEADLVAKLRAAAQNDAGAFRALEKNKAIDALIKRAAGDDAGAAAALREQVSGASRETRKAAVDALAKRIATHPEAEQLSASTRKAAHTVQPRIGRKTEEWNVLRGNIKRDLGVDIGGAGGTRGLADAIGGGLASEAGWTILGYPGKVLARSKAAREFAGKLLTGAANLAPKAARLTSGAFVPPMTTGGLEGARERKGLNAEHAAKLEESHEAITDALAESERAGTLPVAHVEALEAEQGALADAMAGDKVARYQAGLKAAEAAKDYPAGVMLSLAAGPGVMRAAYQGITSPMLRAAARGEIPRALSVSTADDAASRAIDGRAERAPKFELSQKDAARIAKEIHRATRDDETLALQASVAEGQRPRTLGQAVAEVSAGVAYLRAIAPKKPDGYFGEWVPDIVQTARFSRGLSVALRPQTALDALAARQLRHEHVEALKQVHPAIYARAAAVAASTLQHDGEALGPVARDQLKLFLGVPQVSALPILRPGGGPSGGKPQGGGRLDLAGAMRSQLDAMLARRG
jgi:hypothetical protein